MLLFLLAACFGLSSSAAVLRTRQDDTAEPVTLADGTRPVAFVALGSDTNVPQLPAKSPVRCDQPMPEGAPAADELARLIDDYILAKCRDGGKGDSFCEQGYCYFQVSGNVLTDGNTCATAYRAITEECVRKGNYGGQTIVDGQLFNLSSKAYPASPIGEGPFGHAPSAPNLPPPPEDCPERFGGAWAFAVESPEGQSTITFKLDQNKIPQLFSKWTQWRVYTVAQTDIKSWSLEFTGATGPEVTYSPGPVVASFEYADESPLPCECRCKHTLSRQD
jgi:hypothetical protein